MQLPPKLEESFRLLSKGRHISSLDGEVFNSLTQETDRYRAVFDALGYELVDDPQGFFYFNGTRNGLNRTVSEFALFTFIMVDWLSDNDTSIEIGLFGTVRPLEELPHLQSDRYRGYMRQAGGDDADNLRRIIQRMDGAGFLRLYDEKIQFLAPTRRILKVCLALGKKSAEVATMPVIENDDEEQEGAIA
ncbi:hypothetical protein [Cupriavidus sp. DF5525]|uniref:condensin complex protein MksE n=1 Tax=Cupriavidus sp. DF5525 TaxID=3160989 RepID=UPI0032DE6A12